MKKNKEFEVENDKLFPVQQVFVIHDHIYETKEEAKRYEDGKDIAKPFYIIRDEDYENGMESNRVMLYETEQEAKLEFLEMENAIEGGRYMNKALRGIDLVEKLKTLEEDYDLEVKSLHCDSQQAEGYLAFQGVNFDYKYRKNNLFLELNDMETYFEDLPDMNAEELLKNQKYMKQELERLLEVPVVVNMMEKNIKEEVLMNKDTALKVIQQGWGENFKFQAKDNHAAYFESPTQEVKLVIDAYDELGVYSVEGKNKDEEDWSRWDDLTKEDVDWYVKESDKERVLNEEEKQTYRDLKEKLEDLKMDIAMLEGIEPSDEEIEHDVSVIASDPSFFGSPELVDAAVSEYYEKMEKQKEQTNERISSLRKEHELLEGKIQTLFSDKEDEREQESTEKIHWYEMTSRPISPGSQPKGFVDWKEDEGRHGLVAYNRALTEKELNDFEMKEWVEEREMSSYEILEEARTIQENYGFSPYEVEWDNEVFQDYLKGIDPEEHKRFNDLKGQFEKQSKKEKIDETFMERE